MMSNPLVILQNPFPWGMLGIYPIRMGSDDKSGSRNGVSSERWLHSLLRGVCSISTCPMNTPMLNGKMGRVLAFFIALERYILVPPFLSLKKMEFASTWLNMQKVQLIQGMKRAGGECKQALGEGGWGQHGRQSQRGGTGRSRVGRPCSPHPEEGISSWNGQIHFQRVSCF